MDVDVNVVNKNELKVDCILLQKMIFLYNALEKGWVIKKKEEFIYFYKESRR